MYKENWDKLVKKLLSIGGKRVVEVYEEDLDKLLERGKIISGKPRLIKKGMRPSRCHQNSIYYHNRYTKQKPELRIVTGWALTEDDGFWRQHTWLVNKNEIIETTVIRQVYFGFVLEGRELDDFCWNNM